MLRKLFVIFFYVGISVMSITAQQLGPTPCELEEVNSLFSNELAKQNYAGVTAGIVSGNQLVWTQSYGLSDIGNNVEANANTVYPIGSITKQFTALMLLQLVERGRVHLMDPVEKYVPEISQIQNPFPGIAPMTLYQLAIHTSGLPPMPTSLGPTAGLTWEQVVISWLPQLNLGSEPGTHFQYSNVGYSILGLALERAAGRPYPDYVRNEILLPLGMTHTGFVLTPEMAAHVAKGYLLESNGTLSPPLDPTKETVVPNYFWPGGGLFSTVRDMAKFVAFELGEGPDWVLTRSQVLSNFVQLGSGVSDLSFGDGIGFAVYRLGTSVNVGADGAVRTTGGYTASAQMRRNALTGLIFLRNFAGVGTNEPFGPAFEIAVLNSATGIQTSCTSRRPPQ